MEELVSIKILRPITLPIICGVSNKLKMMKELLEKKTDL